MQDYIYKIKDCKLFDGIKSEELQAMFGCLNSCLKSYSKKETVVSDGKIIDAIGIVVEGKLQIVQYEYSGNRAVLSTLSPNRIFGEAFSYTGIKMPLNVEAVEDSKVLFLQSSKIYCPCHNNCTFHNKLINNLFGILAKKNVNLIQKIECMSKKTTREKILSFLEMESVKHASNEFKIPYDRQALADYLGVERSAMSAELGKLRRDGIIESSKNQFKLL